MMLAVVYRESNQSNILKTSLRVYPVSAKMGWTIIVVKQKIEGIFMLVITGSFSEWYFEKQISV